MLHGYADRGMFRYFEQRLDHNGCWITDFEWTSQRRLRLVADLKRGRLICRDLLPDIEARSPLRHAIDDFLTGCHVAVLPEHRRIDPARAKASALLRAGQLSVTLRVAETQDWSYATRKLINLIHELLLFLNLHWANYAQDSLGASQD